MRILLALSLVGSCLGAPSAPDLALSEMASIEGGVFTMGHPEATPGPYGAEWKENELPPHEVELSAYRIDRSEVTVSDWLSFVSHPSHAQAHHHPLQPLDWDGTELFVREGWEERPVVQVSWYDAVAYCAWIGKRLPTEAEWERAARGPEDDRRYPWGGDGADCGRAVFTTGASPCALHPEPVGSRSPDGDSVEGVSDLAGNVAEWVADRYGRYDPEASSDPRGPDGGRSRVVRGGSFRERAASIRTMSRWGVEPVRRSDALGFRCALSEANVP